MPTLPSSRRLDRVLPATLRRLLPMLCLLLAMGSQASDDIATEAPILTLTQGSDRQTLSLDAIEATGDLHHIRMQHPEGPEGRFSGVWLDAFLAQHGLEDARRVRFIADDGYTTFLSQAQRQEKAYLLATRLDGEPIGVDRLGPLMLVVPEDAEAVLDGSVPMDRWIWALEEIRAR
ncbi:Oxidoreductase molybdopterin binding domain protein [Halomonas sp. THAF5a]|uniref:molybdopterin-dependent oxidoreductase n=1 Tax=Halomonas sp. THAF5a TaxID=2587844 RepID=UPI001267ACC8|nr:molybdopterin-dependent oxidoreductase [Halomonas sp. THAF5a]QFU00727.1 Oxidoreductase molybdopterin binding domain protein [Halomonas sp. THAF5a]